MLVDKIPDDLKGRQEFFQRMVREYNHWYLSKRSFLIRKNSWIQDIGKAMISIPFKI